MIGKSLLERIARHMVRAHAIWCFILFLLIAMGATRPAQGEEKSLFLGFRQGKDSESIPEGWALISYLGTGGNQMSVLKENNRTVLHVKSLGSASGVLKNVKVDLKEFPILVWRWKINRVVGMAIERQRDRNDSTARIRVIFGKGGENEGEKPRPVSPQIEEFLKTLGVKQTAREPAGFKIDYIWGNRIARGEVLDYPGSRNHKIVVVESGKANANQWIWEKRNLVEDFELLFEAAPPGLSGIVILTDTDQTNEGVEAWYSSIVLMTE
jgi:hypothetical protein